MLGGSRERVIRPFTAVTRVQIPPGTPNFSLSYRLCLWQRRCPGDEWVTNERLFDFLSDRKYRFKAVRYPDMQFLC